MTNAGIYRILVQREGRPDAYYFGQAINLSGRWKQHLRALRARRHDNLRLQRSFTKYGEQAFLFETLLICEPIRETLTRYEQAILDFYLAAPGGDGNVLNVMRECVNSHLGVKRRPETIAKLSAAMTGKKMTAEQNAANSARMKGFRHSIETRAKMSASKKGKPQHPNTVAAIEAARNTTRLEALRKAVCGKPKIHSAQTIRKISQSLTGKKSTPEANEKRSAALRGRKQSPEEIAKRVASRLKNARDKAEASV